MKYYVDTKDVDKLVKHIETVSDKALLKCGAYFEKKIKEEIRNDSYDTGQLVRSINTKKVSEGKVIVGTNLFYGIVREEGRKPGKFPPLDALVGWTARKGIINSGTTKKYRDLDSEDKGKVYVIARAIAINGTEGKHTFQRVVNNERQNIINLYVKYMNQG